MAEEGVLALTVGILQRSSRPGDGGENCDYFRLGVQDPLTGKSVDANTVFRAGILSQPLFGYMVMRLANSFFIDLDRPLYRYLDRPLPDYPEYSDLAGDPRWKRLTARTVLSHQSGLVGSRRTAPGGRPGFVTSPGKGFGYSEEGYRLLQFVLEKMFRRPLNEIAGIVLFSRLSLSQSSFAWTPQLEGRVALEAGADIGGLRDLPQDAAGSLITTAEDFLSFMRIVFNHGGLLNSMATVGYFRPEIKIDRPRIQGRQTSSEGGPVPDRLGWCLGWAACCNWYEPTHFLGQRSDGLEVFAAHYGAERTSICILATTSGNRSFTGRILGELLKVDSSPLVWLGFDDVGEEGRQR
jgi:CubicO group peptidase (beta-lactamase class C family)